MARNNPKSRATFPRTLYSRLVPKVEAAQGGKLSRLTAVCARRRSLLAALTLIVASSVFVGGCLSPTLPLPPPSRPNVFPPDESGNVRVTGLVQSRATAYVHNQRTDQIAGEVTGSDGRYDIVIAAEVGDRLFVWQAFQTEESSPTEVVVPDTSTSEETPAPPDSMGGSSGQ